MVVQQTFLNRAQQDVAIYETTLQRTMNGCPSGSTNPSNWSKMVVQQTFLNWAQQDVAIYETTPLPTNITTKFKRKQSYV